jgi:glycine cleavage system H protein
VNLRYSADHEWVRVISDDCARIGITDYAQDALGEVVFVEVPQMGARVEAGIMFGEVESTKSVSELFAPVTGEVVAVNEDLEVAPEKVNDDPYGEGWICEVSVESEGELMDAAAYQALIED